MLWRFLQSRITHWRYIFRDLLEWRTVSLWVRKLQKDIFHQRGTDKSIALDIFNCASSIPNRIKHTQKILRISVNW